MRSPRGFTLVELMLAFVVLSFGIVFVLQCFGTALTAIRKVDDTKVLSWMMESEMEELIRSSWEEMGVREGISAGELTTEDGKVYPWKLAVTPSRFPTLNEATLMISKSSGRPASLMSSTYLLKREADEKK